ncbi:MAG: hypothetical protein AAF432_13575 [Planctomycetota bacterium]
MMKHAMIATLVLAGSAMLAPAQSIDEQLDVESYLRGIVDLRLPDVLESYITMHPATDETTAALYDIARARLVAADPTLTPAERQRAVEAVLARRAELLDRERDDVRRPRWIVDQASDLIFDLLGGDGTDITIMFGIPTAEQRERGQRVVTSVEDLLRDAEVEIARTLTRIAPGNTTLRPRYETEERERRIPLLRGMTQLTAGMLADDDATRRNLCQRAVDDLQPLAMRLGGRQVSLSQLYAGIALIQLEQYADANSRLDVVLNDTTNPESYRFMARLARATLAGERDGASAAIDDLSTFAAALEDADLFYRLTYTDHRAMWEHRAHDQHDASTLRAVYQPYLDLLRAVNDAEREQLRALTIDRLATLMTIDVPAESTPTLVTLARARRELAQTETASAGRERLRDLLALPGLSHAEQADALFMLAEHDGAMERWDDAADTYLRIARDFPSTRNAEFAMDFAVRLAATLDRASNGNQAERARYREALDLMLTRYPNVDSINRWRIGAGELALDESRFMDAINHFRTVTPNAERWGDAQILRVRTRRAWAEAGDDIDRLYRLREVQDEVRTVRPPVERSLAAATDEDERQRRQYVLDELDLLDADALLELARYREALALVSPRVQNGQLPADQLGRALFIKIQSHRELNEITASRDALREFAQAAPDRVPAVVLPMLRNLNDSYEKLLDQRRVDDASAMAENDIRPLTELIAEVVPAASPALTLALADGERAAGLYGRARLRYDAMLERYPSAQELLVGRAECLFFLSADADNAGNDDAANAMRLYRRLSATGPTEGGSTYWLAQLRMLELLERTGRNVHKIRPQIAKLRQMDSTLGGPRYEPQFIALERRIAP